MSSGGRECTLALHTREGAPQVNTVSPHKTQDISTPDNRWEGLLYSSQVQCERKMLSTALWLLGHSVGGPFKHNDKSLKRLLSVCVRSFVG